MLSSIGSFILQYKYIIIFYIAVIALALIYRKRVDVQAKIIFLFRMKLGLKWMSKYAVKFREWVILLGYIGTGLGFIGQLFISWILIKNLYDMATTPDAINGVSLVLPGINVPGLGVLPFWYWLLAIFIIAVVHEFAHGIVARAHNVEVKNTGIVLFGPIIGAFVEPNENALQKKSDIVQYSVLAAGSFSNILLALVALLLLTFALSPIQDVMVEPTGFTFDQYVNDSLPFAKAGIPTSSLITGINGVPTMEFQDFSKELNNHKPGDEVIVQEGETNYTIMLANNPDDSSKPFLGIQAIRNEFELKEEYKTGVWEPLYYSVDWLAGFMKWLFLLSLGIGLFNLLPLPIVDGGRMSQVFLQKWKGVKKGNVWYYRVSMFFLLLLLLNLFFPLLLKLF